MGHVHIILDGDGALQDWASEASTPITEHYNQETADVRAVYLSGGMASEPKPEMARSTAPRLPEYEKAWQRFNAAVAECRRLEAKYGLPGWATYIDGNNVVRTIPNEHLPSAYVAAVAEWNAARLARNELYEHGSLA